MVPKEPPCCDDREQATQGLTVAACNHREPLENEGGHPTKDLLEGHIHRQRDVAPPPHQKIQARNTRPPRLHHGSRRIENNIFPLTVGRALTFRRCHSVTADRNKWVKILEEGNTVKERERKRCLCGKRRNWLKYEGRLL